MTSRRQTLEQQRANKAYQDVQDALKDLIGDEQKKYGPLVKKMPSYILTNGLGQSLAFLLSKGKQNEGDPHTLLFKQINNRICGNTDLSMQAITQSSSVQYRRMTIEALAYLTWLKRFAEAEPKLGADEQGE